MAELGAEARELLRRAASVIGHDLRNPMAVINNSAYFVRAKLGQSGLDPKVEKHLKIIEAEIARADKLLGDMLTFSRPFEATAETRDFDAAVSESVKGYAAPEGGKVDLKLGAKGAKAKFDAKALADALKRLLDNAFAAMEDKGTVKVATGTAKDGVFVAVTDSGKGVDPKIEPVMFEAFMTTKPKGLGLGLSLARKFLEAQGGAVSYESTPKGATFRLTLPKA
ncbi:MAG: HAMP domain-containing sensor histidine kinase [Elusimicrobiota bacterium]|nr:HAMP domain-containing sensor histidine kinase [Elusimicrobiota bacterium]